MDRSDGGDGGAPIACSADTDCDDGNACNGVETCAASVCQPGESIDCNDGIPCTDDRCDPADGSCTSTPNHGACSENLMCDPVEGCIAPAACTADDECDDGLFCNGPETCDPAFGCRGGAPPACDDGIGCTVDECDPELAGGVGACTNTPSAAICADSRVCNGDEACDPTSPDADVLGCVPGEPLVCADAHDCTVDGCDEGAGGCVVVSVDSSVCQNGVFCDGAEVCDATQGCIAGTAPTCEDAIGCTIGRCDATLDQCVQDADPTFCPDGLVCNGDERCDVTGTTPGRGCIAGVPVDCSDGLACTTDMCSEPSGTCSHGGSDADGDGYTAVGCGSGNDCNDLSAAIRPGATELCDGVDNDCNGVIDDGSGMECALGSGPRACTTGCGTGGTRACTAACTLTPCTASSESCNDCDDDGDGAIDDGLACRRGTTTGCTTTCATPGLRICASDCSGYGACVAATETCNDCDDDGDGVADDGLACRRGSTTGCMTTCGTAGNRVCAADCTGYGACRAAAETCNGCDDDGNGTADDGLVCRQGATQSCTTACLTPGVRTCASDCTGYGACVASSETCNGCDDDGDGTSDEGFTCRMGETRNCMVCGVTGTQTCNGSCSGWSACTAAEQCNNCDDDGDGSTDEDFACRQGATTSCTTSCMTAGVRTCDSTCSAYGGCVATEVCNGCDDDGDTSPDDGFACVQGSTRACTVPVCGTTGTEACNGTCSGYSQCAATEVCNGCDDDRDGAADDGFTCVAGSSQSCVVPVCGTTGSRTCNGTCSDYGACTATEVCNGCDDDADGTADNGFTCAAGSTSACTVCGGTGSRTCNGSCNGYSACAAAAEVCGNACDDDADGQTDEGCVAAPPNDVCASAITLSGASGTRTGDSFDGATANVSDCASGAEIWYRITVGARSVLYLDTFGSSFDTKISVRSSCGGTYLQCEDDDCGTQQDVLTRELAAGTYYIAVHAFSAGTTGTVSLRWATMTTGSGSATRVTANGSVSGTTSGTGSTAGSCGSYNSGPENLHYFTICPSASHTVTAATCSGASWDTVLYMRDASGAELTCSDDYCSTQSSITYSMTGPGLYGVFVDAWNLQSGAYTLTFSGL